MFSTKSKLLSLGYVLLFLSSVVFDQSTKLHSEKSFLLWSHATDARSYRSDKARVSTWGVSPSLARERQLPASDVTANWVDFHLTYVRNPGAAWGSFSNAPEMLRIWGFYAITLFVSGLIVTLFRSTHPGQRLARASLVLVLSGAAGNFIDRLFLRYVIDWLQFHWRIAGWEYSFPVFNWADVVINVGIALMVVDMLFTELLARRKSSRTPLNPQNAF